MQPYSVLFLCTGNSARSIMAEVLLNSRGEGRFRAYSAGSAPKGTVHPLAIETLRGHGLPTEGLRSKSWNEFAGADAPRIDFVVTVCDNAAAEVCPVWPGSPIKAHWGIADPAAAAGTEEAQRRAFATAFNALESRVAAITRLSIDVRNPRALQAQLREIGELPEDPA